MALVGVEGTRAALDLLDAARAGLPALSAAEIFYADGLILVRAYAGIPSPFAMDYPACVLLECSGTVDPTDDLLEFLSECPAVGDATVATDTRGRARLWAYRECHTDAINAAGVPVKLDVSVAVAQLPSLVEQLPAVVSAVAPGARTILFGHLNEGNLHVNVLAAGALAEPVSDAVLHLVAAHHGSISSEHGVGRAKVAWLGLSRSPEEIATMWRIKAALDPAGLLNPGVLLPGSTAAGSPPRR